MRTLVVQESDWLKRGPHQSHHLMERLSLKGHQIRVIDFEIDWRKSEDREKELVSRRQVFQGMHKAVTGNTVTVIRPPIIKRPVLDYLSLIYSHRLEIKRQIKEFRPDVIVGFGILNANIAIRLAKPRGIPFVYYIIDELHRLVPQKQFRGLARKIESDNMRNADLVLSINEGLREYTIMMGADESKTLVIRAGVDLERFQKAGGRHIRQKYGIKDDDTVLFFMGWLYDFSGLKEVAQELARSNGDNIKLLVVGKGDLWDTLQSIKNENGMDDRIITIPWVPYEEVPDYLAASDICILPAYKNEIMMNIVPIKMYEYMASAKPVIATSLPGIAKEFGMDNGVIYVDSPNDVMPETLKLIQENNISYVGQRSFEYIKDNDWDIIVRSFESLLEVISNDKKSYNYIIGSKRLICASDQDS
jgi:glycosyltransferase involved in cell wall biosynthesis